MKINKALLLVLLLLLSSFFLFNRLTDQQSLDRQVADCNQLDRPQKLKCWSELVEQVLKRQGLDKAFTAVAEMTEVDPSFASSCHDFVHLLGNEAYELFLNDEDFTVGNKSSYCAYGFYHGFMERLVSESGDLNLAREFCDYIDSQLREESSAAYLACYHGIGHGWTNVHDESLWGSEQLMIDPALSLCEQVAPGAKELEICATGVFDSISIGYYNQAYGLKINRDDPLWICRAQKDQYKGPCYMDMMPAIIWLGDYRLDQALPYLAKAEPQFRAVSVATLAENSVRFVLRRGEDIKDSVVICRGLSAPEYLDCFSGLPGGLMQFGPPQKEHVAALAFCHDDFLTEEEKQLCFDKVLDRASLIYSATKAEEICRLAGSYCPKNQ